MSAVAAMSRDTVIAGLRDKIERLLAEKAALADDLATALATPDLPVYLDQVLCRQEARLMAYLIKREFVSQDAAALVIARRGGEYVSDKHVGVILCQVRKKIRRFGLEIATNRGSGWYLPAQSRARLARNEVPWLNERCLEIGTGDYQGVMFG